MAKVNEAAAMEIDDPNSNISDQISPKFSINVLQLLKSAQMQHGLRHGDYTRYRFLHVVLYMAERAWSHAMEKRQLPDGPNARQRIYLIGRLRKAVKWADLFSHLCSVKGDSRTSLEAEAYASYMKGNLLFEQDRNWDTALRNFKSARSVYEELGKYGDLENQVLCRERVEELEPSIRYCLHKIGGSNLQASELLQIGEMEGPASDLFKSKLEAVMAEARSQQAASLTEFHWLGNRFPITNAKTRVAILKAQELEKDLHGPLADSLSAEKRLVTFDKVFTAYHEARSCIRSDLASAGSAENVKDDLNGLDKAVSAVLGQRTIERNQLLVSIAKSKLTRRRDDKNEKVTKPEELVRLYDLLLQNTADLSDLVSSGRDRKPEEVTFAEECELKSLAFRAERCFYLARSYSLAGKRSEAYALYCRARSLAENALWKFQAHSKTDQVMIKELKTLYDECRSYSCIEHATGIIEEVKAPENLSKKISTISLTGADKKVEKYLLEKLDLYESAISESNVKAVPRIEPFPPAFQSIPRNPIVLDLAYNAIDFPSIENRMKKDKKGFISRLWG
ncbi:Signal recognition particle 68 kDa [Gossypium arboreum]|uniref:Signal recognition particle subunit SRP68 n=1 Tax=Gossypium arboreum TaxID=29729 RepID=A0A0B0MY19_GOSAR|nr:Signal recognition particle 68 kDa [Gossypium arboreum]KHG10533.1 Signal recognition particle 68 kDa [Gossypium arboreum]